jgi:beta-glucanase (GH16 family)
VTFDSSGAHFTISESGDSPTIVSNFYIMFGRLEVTLLAAPGVGIVSSVVMESDDLDEIDWEWLGADATQVQSNYFGKGQTGSYDRGAFHPAPNNQQTATTYAIDWNANQIVWEINGDPVRTLAYNDAANGAQYPQTPMRIKIGSWSGGDPSNAPGTIQWAGGSTDYSAGPYTFTVQKLTVTDASTGTEYQYSDTTGSWQSIKAVGGTISGNKDSGADSSVAAVSATSMSPSVPAASLGDASITATRTGYPWVSSPTTLQTSSFTTSYAGLPSGWTVTSSGKVIPPSSASVSMSFLPHCIAFRARYPDFSRLMLTLIS